MTPHFFWSSSTANTVMPKSTCTIPIEGGSRLVLNVTEGPQAILGAINFVGNNHVPAEKLFEYVVGPTRERYSRLQKELPFVAADIQEGADLLHRYYVGEGYLEATVDAPQFHFSADGARVDITIPVHEGRQYFFRRPDFSRKPYLRSGNVTRADARFAFATLYRPPG